MNVYEWNDAGEIWPPKVTEGPLFRSAKGEGMNKINTAYLFYMLLNQI